MQYPKLAETHINWSTVKIMKVTAALVYLGGGESSPRSQVESIPPALVITVKDASETALRV